MSASRIVQNGLLQMPEYRIAIGSPLVSDAGGKAFQYGWDNINWSQSGQWQRKPPLASKRLEVPVLYTESIHRCLWGMNSISDETSIASMSGAVDSDVVDKWIEHFGTILRHPAGRQKWGSHQTLIKVPRAVVTNDYRVYQILTTTLAAYCDSKGILVSVANLASGSGYAEFDDVDEEGGLTVGAIRDGYFIHCGIPPVGKTLAPGSVPDLFKPVADPTFVIGGDLIVYSSTQALAHGTAGNVQAHFEGTRSVFPFQHDDFVSGGFVPPEDANERPANYALSTSLVDLMSEYRYSHEIDPSGSLGFPDNTWILVSTSASNGGQAVLQYSDNTYLDDIVLAQSFSQRFSRFKHVNHAYKRSTNVAPLISDPTVAQWQIDYLNISNSGYNSNLAVADLRFTADLAAFGFVFRTIEFDTDPDANVILADLQEFWGT